MRLAVAFVCSIALLPGVASEPESTQPVSYVDVTTLRQFLMANPSPESTAIELQLAHLDPFDLLCTDFYTEPWIVGSRLPVGTAYGGSYYVELPLAAYGVVREFIKDGQESQEVQATRTDNDFTQADLEEYLAAVGIYYSAHDGIGTTAYARLTVGASDPLVGCPRDA